ncbi:MAG: hypothetical protein IJV73_02100, partial [Clostridia bacterium]|nr:hypothetical protein [Clostridia bacterium]
IPNIIKIVDDAVRRDIEVCKGAIGWIEQEKGVEILYLYDEWIDESEIQFLPFVKCDAVYCMDPFDRTKFINSESVFERANNEKIAELEHVAYCLGAKSCSIEIVEANTNAQSTKLHLGIGISKITAKSENALQAKSQNAQSGKNTTYFEGHSNPQRPKLKWFAHDDNINNLIDMRCTDCASVKYKILEIKASNTVALSQKNACAIDNILKIKGDMSLEKQANSEHSSKLIFEVEL